MIFDASTFEESTMGANENKGAAGQAMKDILRKEGGAAVGTIFGAAADRIGDSIRGGPANTYDDYDDGGGTMIVRGGGLPMSPVAMGAIGIGVVALIILAVK